MPCPKCGVTLIDPRAKSCHACRWSKATPAPAAELPPDKLLAADRERNRSAAQLRSINERYKAAQDEIERLSKALGIKERLADGFDTYRIEPKKSTGLNEATAFAVASDWHFASRVGAEVGGLNEFSPAIAKQRADTFFTKVLQLTDLMAEGINIPHIVMPLLGDFVTNHIHEEFKESNTMLPMDELWTVQRSIASGIQYLLDNSDRELTFVCHSGNHARTTRETQFGTENGHSLEWLMYQCLADHFSNELRVAFIIPPSPHSYMDVYGTTIRFQHGHMVKYQGGVGGLTIPLNKAIAQWNRGRHADLDVLGHFHQMFDGGNFIVNGSLIGYDSYALSIKASFEKPKQAMFVLDQKRGRTFTWPVLL